jgi:hypothetical protein
MLPFAPVFASFSLFAFLFYIYFQPHLTNSIRHRVISLNNPTQFLRIRVIGIGASENYRTNEEYAEGEVNRRTFLLKTLTMKSTMISFHHTMMLGPSMILPLMAHSTKKVVMSPSIPSTSIPFVYLETFEVYRKPPSAVGSPLIL